MKDWKSSLMFAATLSSITAPAIAADWYTLFVGGTDAVWFFDAATVEKSKDVMRVWVKTYRTRNADTEGAWATAQRVDYDCAKRTFRAMSISDYHQDGSFKRSWAGMKEAADIVPDSIGESLLQTVCAKDFPLSRSNKNYVKTPSNNPGVFTKFYVEQLDSQTDQAPK